MAFVQIYRWGGHLGLVVQTQSGQRTFITMRPETNQAATKTGMFREWGGEAMSLPADLRFFGLGNRENFLQRGIEIHAAKRQAPNFQLRPGQKVVMDPQEKWLGAPMAPVGRRVSIRQAGSVGPGNDPRVSLVLAAGQVYKPPDEIVTLPAHTENQLGIDTEKIFYWWKSYAGRIVDKNQGRDVGDYVVHNRFKFVSTHLNCAGTVYLALRVGGATYFKGRTHVKLYADGEGVINWAKKVKTAIEELNQAATTTKARYESKRAEFQRKIGRNQQGNPDDLPTLEEWKAISYVGVMARRKEQIADMDRELQIYHTLSWDNDHHIEQKARALGNIMRSAEEHARLKPMSDRSHAVSYLLSKAWEVMERRLALNDNEQEFRNQRRDERNAYNSLAFTDAEFKKLFMDDEWIVDRDHLEYEDVRAETVHDDWFNDARRNHQAGPVGPEDDDN